MVREASNTTWNEGGHTNNMVDLVVSLSHTAIVTRAKVWAKINA